MTDSSGSHKTHNPHSGNKQKYVFKPVPIIFVPGIMGSRLHFSATGNDWDPENAGEMLHWVRGDYESMRRELHFDNAATLIQRGKTPNSAIHKLGGVFGADVNDPDDRTDEEIARFYGEVVHSFYIAFLRNLHAQGHPGGLGPMACPVYAAGYDWRQSNAKSGEAVAARIKAVLAREKAEHFILITHSMGSLVTRSLLKKHADLSAKLTAVIHVVPPTLGAVVFYRRCFTGAISELDGTGTVDEIIERVMGGSPAKFLTLVSAMPGPIELLPTNGLRNTNGTPWLRHTTAPGAAEEPYPGADIYAQYQSSARPPGLFNVAAYTESVKNSLGGLGNANIVADELGKRIVEAKAFHNTLVDEGKLYKHPNTWAIYGTGLPTDVDIVFRPAAAPKDSDYHEAGVIIRQLREDTWAIYSEGPSKGINRAFHPPPPSKDLDHREPGIITRRPKEGDGTVPAYSGAALFPGKKAKPADVKKANRQYEVPGLEHGAAFTTSKATNLVIALLKDILKPA